MRFLIFTILFFLIAPFLVFAQTAPDTDLILSWRADSYVESGYSGKILPAGGSRVQLALQLLDAGRPVSLLQNKILWFLNNKPLANGLGLATASFIADELRAGGDNQIKVMVEKYKNTNLQRLVDIPVAKSEAVLKLPYPNGEITPGSYILKSLLYFWNIGNPADLIFDWRANGEPAASMGEKNIEIAIPDNYRGTSVNLSLSVKNPRSDLAFADIQASLLVK